MGNVVVIGSLHMDIMVNAPDRPRKGETLRGSAWGLRCGGKGGNQAVQAAYHGATVQMIGRVGTDDFGAQLRDHLAQAGVDTHALRTDPTAGSGMSVAIVDATGDYGAVIVSGVNMHIDESDIEAARPLLDATAVLVLQYEIPLPMVALAAQAAHQQGARVILNAAPAYPPPPGLLPSVDILVVNEVEGEMLSGVTITEIESAHEACRRLRESVKTVILTLGERGVIAADGDQQFHLPAYRVDVVDTHGAGDAFVGALAARLADHSPLMDALRYASAAAALVCAKVGVASPERVHALMQTT